MQTNTTKPLVLTVDDETEFQSIMHVWLAPGYQHCALKDGDELLGALRVDVPDLVILDLHLPGADGFELCRRLRATPGLESLPVLFLTGSHDVKDYQKNFRAGGTSYLMKPISRLQLLNAVEDLLGENSLTRSQTDVGGED